MNEKSEQKTPNGTPVFVLGSTKRKYGVVMGFNGYLYMVEFDNGETIEVEEEYLVKVPKTKNKE